VRWFSVWQFCRVRRRRPRDGRACHRHCVSGLSVVSPDAFDAPALRSPHFGPGVSDRGIMWVTFGHLRPSGHIMPDHAGDRGAVFLVLAPHDHPAIQHERSHTCRRSVTGPVSKDQDGRREPPAEQGRPGAALRFGSSISVIITCSTKIKMSGRLSGKPCSWGPVWSLRVLAWARVFPGQRALPAVTEPDGGSW
jgi:hypothetical protein